MKKRTFFCSLLVLLLAMVAAAGCGKDYACQCEGGINGKPDAFRIKKDSKKRAEKACKNYNTPPGTPDGFYNCKLQ